MELEIFMQTKTVNITVVVINFLCRLVIVKEQGHYIKEKRLGEKGTFKSRVNENGS